MLVLVDFAGSKELKSRVIIELKSKTILNLFEGGANNAKG